jgi:FKBP-type peptidyl-prolyl cis-trans isomerase
MNKLAMTAAMGILLTLTACGRESAETSQETADETAAAEEEAQALVATDCPQPGDDGIVEIRSGLTAKITKKGYGRAAVSKDYADVHTTLWLYDEAAEGGRGVEIWSSGGTDPFQFQLDAGQVIKGWDLGVNCMLVGETRELKIAPELGYGARGKPPVPPGATLLFEIELVKLTSPE